MSAASLDRDRELDLELRGVSLRYDDGTRALQDVDLTVAAGTILGLLGRNGSGKTSLMSLVASLRRPTAGAVLLGGADPWEDRALTGQVTMVGEGGDKGEWSVRDALATAQALRPRWDDAYARRLLDRFDIPTGKIARLSRGKRAALRCVFGLASRAAVTMFDEAHLGMDAPARYAFYDEVLADYMAHPRTVILSTHHIDEVASLFGQVAILDRGRLLTHAETDGLRAQGAELTGPTPAVDDFVTTTGVRVLSTRSLGGTTAVAAYGELTDEQRHHAAAAGLDIGPIPLQDLFVHLTADDAGAADAPVPDDEEASP